MPKLLVSPRHGPRSKRHVRAHSGILLCGQDRLDSAEGHARNINSILIYRALLFEPHQRCKDVAVVPSLDPDIELVCAQRPHADVPHEIFKIHYVVACARGLSLPMPMRNEEDVVVASIELRQDLLFARKLFAAVVPEQSRVLACPWRHRDISVQRRVIGSWKADQLRRDWHFALPAGSGWDTDADYLSPAVYSYNSMQMSKLCNNR